MSCGAHQQCDQNVRKPSTLHRSVFSTAKASGELLKRRYCPRFLLNIVIWSLSIIVLRNEAQLAFEA
jgi:hypothetical protein